MDSDVKKILDCCEVMKECFIRLERRGVKSFEEPGEDPDEKIAGDRYNAIAAAANTFRWFRDIEIAGLRAAFDPEYKEQMKILTLKSKAGGKD